jgi:YHS domain-containing protein
VAFLIRALGYLIASIVVISALRAIIGALMKGVGELFGGASRSPQPGARPSPAGMGGELKKDPVCGTFISPATAFQKALGGETYYFCSIECRDKFKT